MQETSISGQILAHVKKHPAQTAKEIAAALGFTPKQTTSRLAILKAAGRVHAKVAGHNKTGNEIFGYFFGPAADPATQHTRRKAKPVAIVPATPAEMPTLDATPADSPVASAVESLANAIAQQVAMQIMSSLEPMLAARIASITQHIAPPSNTFTAAAPPKAEKRQQHRIAIVGLNPQQAGMISTEYGNTYALQFPERENARALKSAATQNDACYLMTDFVSHSAQSALVNAGANMIRVSGGMSSLRRLLTAKAGL